MDKSNILQKGQVLLIIVLTMVVALTVGLSLVSRSIISVKNTNEEANSQKAFQAAEAGVEIALKKPIVNQDIIIGQKTIDNGSVINQIIVHPLSGSSVILNDGSPVAQDEGMDVWLTNYPNYSGGIWTGDIHFYWGQNSGCQDAALEVIVLSGTSGSDPTATMKKYGIDPCGSNSVDPSQDRTGSNKFSPASAGGTVLGKTFKFSTAISITNGLIIRVIPLYSNTPIGIMGFTGGLPPILSKPFPPQGRVITSTASFGTTERKVSYFDGFPLLPSEFFFTIFQP